MNTLWQALKQRLGLLKSPVPPPSESLEEATEKVKQDLDALVSAPPVSETEPARPAESTVTEPPAPTLHPFMGAFEIAWLSDKGRMRQRNEDALFVLSSEQEGSDSISPFALLVLADGMGGHQAGEQASALACRTASAYLLSELYIPLLEVRERASAQLTISEMLGNAVTRANRLVVQNLPGSGTTLTCGMILGSRLFVAHVGDSRAYLIRPPGLPKALTHDHSLVSRLVEMGQLTTEEANTHPQRNVLYRAVGQTTTLEVDIFTETLEVGDYVLLCCDGLWGVVPEAEIAHIIYNAPSVHEAVHRLVEAANAAGGPDNITVILARIGPAVA